MQSNPGAYPVLIIVLRQHPEIHQVAHDVWGVIVKRLDALYLETMNNNPRDPILHRLLALCRRTRAAIE